MKEGDFYTEEELELEGWKYQYHISGGTHAYEKGDEVIFWTRSTHKVESLRQKAKFSYP